MRKEAAHTVATILNYFDDEKLNKTIQSLISTSGENEEWQTQAGHLLIVAFIARLLSDRLDHSMTSSMANYVSSLLTNDHRGVQHDAITAAGEILVQANKLNATDISVSLLTILSPLIVDDLASVRQLTASRIGWFAQHSINELSHAQLELTVPQLLTRMTDSNGPVKRSSESALYHLLSFHRGTERAEKIINQFGAKMKKDSSATVAAMISTAKKTLVRLDEKEMRAPDELLGNEENNENHNQE